MESGRIPPGQLLRSFLLVAGSYVAVWASMLLALFLAGAVFFPSAFELLTAPQVQPAELQRRATEVLPWGLFWIVAGCGTLVALATGAWIMWRAGGGGWGHSFFLAILLFASGLQMVVGAHADVRWMAWTMTLLLPAASLLGGRLTAGGSMPGDLMDEPESHRPD